MKILTLLLIISLTGCYYTESKKPEYKYEIHDVCEAFGITLLIIDRKQDALGVISYELIDNEAYKYTVRESWIRCRVCDKEPKDELKHDKRNFKYI